MTGPSAIRQAEVRASIPGLVVVQAGWTSAESTYLEAAGTGGAL